MEVHRLLSCFCALQGVLPKVTSKAPFPQSSEVDREIFYSIMVAGGRNKPMSWAFRGFMPNSKSMLPTNLCFNLNDAFLSCSHRRITMKKSFKLAIAMKMMQLLTFASTAQNLGITTKMEILS
jgi:hypothetical protein